MARATEANSREGEMERQRKGGRKGTTNLLKCDQLFLLLCHNTCLPLVQSFGHAVNAHKQTTGSKYQGFLRTT